MKNGRRAAVISFPILRSCIPEDFYKAEIRTRQKLFLIKIATTGIFLRMLIVYYIHQ